MFSSKNLFSSVQCPYKESCLMPRCIFDHSDTLPKTGNENSVKIISESEKSYASKCCPPIVILDASQESYSNKEQEIQEKICKNNIDNSEALRPRPSTTVDENVKKRKLEKSMIGSNISPLSPQRRKTIDQKLGQISKKSESRPDIPMTSVISTLKKPVLQASKVLSREALNPRALKVPAPASHDIRYRLLQALYNEFNRLNSEIAKDHTSVEAKLHLPDQALIKKALDFEEETAISSPLVYSNLVKNKILAYKRMSIKQWVEEREKENEMLEAKKAFESSSSSSLKSNSDKLSKKLKPIETGLSLNEELYLLPKLRTDLNKLSDHGYVSEVPTDKEIESARQGVEAARGWEICDRCKTRFQVFPERREKDGALTSGGQCTYHYGKTYLTEPSIISGRKKREKRYRCCGESVGDSSGCTSAPSHVFKVSEVKRLASILNYQKTPENPDRAKTKRPICLDGEMGYTVNGLELIRLTVTSWPDGQDVFDILVRPMGSILDLNSRYSGVYPKHIANALPWTPDLSFPTDSKVGPPIVSSLVEARALLFSYLSPDTPLIGHGLENDLNAIRVIHPVVIDTALLFPHRLGLPFRNSLKELARNHLNWLIQSGDEGNDPTSMAGHDSRQDAIAAGELVRYALKIRKEKLREMS